MSTSFLGVLAILIFASLEQQRQARHPSQPDLNPPKRLSKAQVAQANKAWAEFVKLHPLGSDARLRVRLSVVAVNPRLEVLLSRLEEATGLRFSLDPSLADHAPQFGDLQLPSVAAYSVMELIAKCRVADGRWEKTADGYRLTGVSQVPRPPGDSWSWRDVVFLTVLFVAAGFYFIFCLLAAFSRSRPLPPPLGGAPAGSVIAPSGGLDQAAGGDRFAR